MVLTCQHLLNTYPQAWTDATVHPFLTQCHDGSIQPAQFNTWLVQDYRFVVEFTRMLAQTLASAPVAHFDTLLGGMGALKEELNWFRTKATERSLDLTTPPQSTCRDYCAFMASLADRSYAVQAIALWAIELAYNQGWKGPGPMAPPYDEFANRWGNDGFTEYVNVLAQQADEALISASSDEEAQATAVFLKVAELEQAFWQMAFNAGG